MSMTFCFPYGKLIHCFTLSFFIWPLFPPQFHCILIGSYSLVSSLQLQYGLGRGEGREPCVLHNTTQPSRTASWHNARLTRKQVTPMCQRKHTVHLAIWSACTAPGPPQESLERDGTRTSLPAKHSLTRTTLGQLCPVPWVSRSWPAATEPGL
jgi:hypothetical protein